MRLNADSRPGWNSYVRTPLACAIAGVGHLVARGTTGDPVLSLVRPAYGGRWLVGGSPYDRPTLVGRAGNVELPRAAGGQRRILIGAVAIADAGG